MMLDRQMEAIIALSRVLVAARQVLAVHDTPASNPTADLIDDWIWENLRTEIAACHQLTREHAQAALAEMRATPDADAAE